MRWEDEGIVVWRVPLGERSFRVGLLTREHGLSAGLVRFGRDFPRGSLELGNYVKVQWSARLSDHLGVYRCSLLRSHASYILGYGGEYLLVLNSLCDLLRLCLPERQPMLDLFLRTESLVSMLSSGGSGWAMSYCLWELSLLDDLGYGLDMGSCVLGGGVDDLAYVSPRSGRCVSGAMAGEYRDRLLRLPLFLRSGGGECGRGDLHSALLLTGYFLRRYVLLPVKSDLPDSRIRLANFFE